MCLLAAMTCVNSCSPAQERLVAKGLVEGEPCAPPCWQGLVPGVSTQEEVEELLRTSRYVDPESIYKDTQWGPVAIWWQRRWQTQGENSFTVQDGVLEVMSMYLDSQVTVEQLMNRYGPPDKFAADFSVHPEPVYIVVHLFYRELGMMLELRLSEDDRELSPEAEIVRIRYFEPAALDDLRVTLVWGKGRVLEDDQLELLEQWLQGWHDWQGYGTLEPNY